ncbi:ferrous iron transport protein B [Parvularcula marina]|uniref:Ferrous iron transport protein B n=1 Tax=Parvularcula marina TaxID=2292771 RepID=A0A371R7U7_9PROT|nr:ferrous iron transport protein B [Parvularcula marina]RFB01498.1 ferrous iron transport protein B [Parvularcula marina]
MTVLNPVTDDPISPEAIDGAGPVIALVGPPNAGKSTLFNGLTGGRAKVGNYPGVTVELREGRLKGGPAATIVDLPGITGLHPRSADARVTVEVLEGRSKVVPQPDLLIAVIDAGQLRRQLPFIGMLTGLGIPMIVSLNMYDLAERDGVKLNPEVLSAALGVPVVPTTAPRGAGRRALMAAIEGGQAAVPQPLSREAAVSLADEIILEEPGLNKFTKAVDSVVLHPVFGILLLLGLLFVIFQAVFAWAETPMNWIDAGVAQTAEWVQAILPDNWFEGLIVDGIIAGVGSVIIFLPQIIILFFFILILEMSGYMARAAFLADELMLRTGLNGRAFIPLLSSFACAIPGMMAARTLDNERDRLTTILVAPLMTCSARLPVYTVLIGAFVPATKVGPFGTQGLVMFGLYIAAIIFGVLVAFVLRKTVTKGGTQHLLMELPTYKRPHVTELFLGLWQRSKIFLRRAGTVIFTVSVILWFLLSYPSNEIRESYAGKLGSILEPIFKPIGFTLEMVIALVPGIAAREVAVGALGTVYAVQNADEELGQMSDVLASEWTLAPALAFLAWYVFAPQCISTIAVARRETNSAKWTWFMVIYLFALAYIAAGITYWTTIALGGS